MSAPWSWLEVIPKDIEEIEIRPSMSLEEASCNRKNVSFFT